MAGSPFFEVETENFKAIFILGAEDDPPTLEYAEAQIFLTDGSAWSASFFTLAEIQRVMDRCRDSGECGGGQFFNWVDLIIVREPGIPSMVRAVTEGLKEGPPSSILKPLSPSWNDADGDG